MVKTSAQKWDEAVSKYKDKCRKIMSLSKSIRYAGVTNEFGRTLTGTLRPGVKPLLNAEQIRNEFFIISTLMSLGRELSSIVGSLDHVVLQHHKVSIIAFQKRKITYYVSVDSKEKNLDKIISLVRKSI